MERETLARMEAELARHGLSVRALCLKAGVAETTWGRWKRGEVGPQLRTWTRVEAAFREITAESMA